MQPFLKDAAGLGALLWLIGYLASLALYFSPFATSMGWIILAIFTPFTILVTWWWFRTRALTLVLRGRRHRVDGDCNRP